MQTSRLPQFLGDGPLHLILFLFSVATATGAERALYLAPSETSAPVARVPADDPALAEAVPVVELRDGDPGPWLWTEYPVPLEGYLDESSMGKNFSIESQTALREGPDHTSRQLTTLDPGDTVEVLDATTPSIRVRVTKTLPVYLKTERNPEPEVEMTPYDPLPIALDPETEHGSASDSTSAIEPLDPSEMPQGNASIVAEPETSGPRQPTRPPEATPGSPTRTFWGKLERSLPRPFGGSRYPLRLKIPGSGSLAYVDASRLFVRDFRPFLGQNVVVTGEVRPVAPGEPDLVILARTLRLAD